MTKLKVEEMAAFCKQKGFIFNAADIYGGLSGFFDFGPLGVELKNNLKNLYRKEFIHKREDMFEQDGSIITNPKVWKASGHVDNFGDLVLTTKKSKTKIRADHFIEDELDVSAEGLSAEDINELVKKHNLKYNGEDFEEVKDFNLMFSTSVGADTSSASTAYLRPETCQSIFPNFRLIADTSRAKLPFGIVQMGKAFRNEISPRDFIFRCREFEQIEMEYFIDPENTLELEKKVLERKIKFWSKESQDENNKEMKEIKLKELQGEINNYHIYWLYEAYEFFTKVLGLKEENLRIREHTKTELSHYSSATLDIDYKYPMGFKELMGIANRTDYDLKQHQKHSKSKLELYDDASQRKVLPHVIEPSLGVERLFFAVLYDAYEDDKERGNKVLKLQNKLAPYKVAVFPLMNKEELVSKAKEIKNMLIDQDLVCLYDKSGSVGKRYARQDEIGTPYTITVDYESLKEKKDTFTIRNRDDTKQVRVNIKELARVVDNLVQGKVRFDEL
ncbi:MAG: glycine--tRNA ligase [Candidatus Woesearchaeota archaeon]